MPRAKPTRPARVTYVAAPEPFTKNFEDAAGELEEQFALKVIEEQQQHSLQMRSEIHALELEAQKVDTEVSRRLRILAGTAFERLEQHLAAEAYGPDCPECGRPAIDHRILKLQQEAAKTVLDRSAHVAKKLLEVQKTSSATPADGDPIRYILDAIESLPQEKRWSLILKVRAMEVPDIVDVSQ